MTPETSLETAMDEVRRLSALRDEALALRKEGLAGLGQRKNYKQRKGWVAPGDDVEKGILTKALWKGPLPAKAPSNPCWSELPGKLATIEFDDLFLPPDRAGTDALADDRVPVLRSAVALDALSAIPGQVLSNGALNCYFRIAYELNEASNADQMLGGASSGGQGVPQTAFITSWCVRAVQSLADTLSNTARMIESFSALQESKPDQVPQIWWDQHLKTQELSLLASLGQANNHLLVPLSGAEPLSDAEPKFKEQLSTVISQAVQQTGALEATKPPDHFNSYAFERAKTSCQTLKGLLGKSLLPATGGKARSVDLEPLKAALSQSSKHLRTILESSRKYFRQVLDHELVAGVIHSQRTPDAAELLFATDGLSRLGSEDGQALRSALERVASLVTNHGRIPSYRPFDVKEKGYVLHVAGSEVIRAFAELATRERWAVSADTAQRLLRHFSDTWREEFQGWRHERDDAQGRCQWWLGGLSLLALDALVRMLDARINQLILQHFSVRQPNEISFELGGLFYPDYGLAALKFRKSVAEILQRMRAHVCGVELNAAPIHSAIFYGPPGTGKTTLPEALARTANAPLVEVTPSDIVLGGIEKTEARARVVFEALSLLSGVVILFDEFDSILWDRAARKSGEGILQFVTPGMLPKLKKLYDRAKERRTAFILSTNLIGGLDPAAIREGRFDQKVGIYPPDVVSRTGRLWMELAKMGQDKKASQRRSHEVVAASAGLAMGFLARPGRFTQPKKGSSEEGSPIHYAIQGGAIPKWPTPEKKLPDAPRADYSGQPDTWTPNTNAFRDWKEWKLVAFLDDSSQKDLAAFQRTLERITEQASNPTVLESLERGLNDPSCDNWDDNLKGFFPST